MGSNPTLSAIIFTHKKPMKNLRGLLFSPIFPNWKGDGQQMSMRFKLGQ